MPRHIKHSRDTYTKQHSDGWPTSGYLGSEIMAGGRATQLATWHPRAEPGEDPRALSVNSVRRHWTLHPSTDEWFGKPQIKRNQSTNRENINRTGCITDSWHQFPQLVPDKSSTLSINKTEVDGSYKITPNSRLYIWQEAVINPTVTTYSILRRLF